MLKATMLHQLIEYMKEKNLMVLALQETKVARTAQYVSEGHHVILFGNEKKKKKEHAGVGFIVHPRVWRCMGYTKGVGRK
eukprot:7830384-Alexandrium_andersonii.AAC.1